MKWYFYQGSQFIMGECQEITQPVKEQGQSGYLGGDFNMNVQVNTDDRMIIWDSNAAKGKQVPE